MKSHVSFCFLSNTDLVDGKDTHKTLTRSGDTVVPQDPEVEVEVEAGDVVVNLLPAELDDLLDQRKDHTKEMR